MFVCYTSNLTFCSIITSIASVHRYLSYDTITNERTDCCDKGVIVAIIIDVSSFGSIVCFYQDKKRQ